MSDLLPSFCGNALPPSGQAPGEPSGAGERVRKSQSGGVSFGQSVREGHQALKPPHRAHVRQSPALCERGPVFMTGRILLSNRQLEKHRKHRRTNSIECGVAVTCVITIKQQDLQKKATVETVSSPGFLLQHSGGAGPWVPDDDAAKSWNFHLESGVRLWVLCT